MENLLIGLIVLNVVITITVISVIIVADNQNQTAKLIEKVKEIIKGE